MVVVWRAPVMLALARSARGIGDVPAAERLSERASQLFADPAVPARDKDRFDLAMLQIDLAYARGRTEDLQAAIVKAGKEAAAYGRQVESGEDSAKVDALEKAGKLKKIPFADRAAMKKLVDPVIEAYAKEIGADQILAKINALK